MSWISRLIRKPENDLAAKQLELERAVRRREVTDRRLERSQNRLSTQIDELVEKVLKDNGQAHHPK